MRILIAGSGTIGYHLAASLAAEGHDIVVIDQNSDRLAKLENNVDCQLIHGSALSPLLMESVGIRSTDLVIAVTQSDATNMMICRLADFYRVPEKMARIRDLELASNCSPIPTEHFGIDHIISPELLTVEHVERLVLSPGATEAMDFENGRIALRGLVVSEDSTIAGNTIADIRNEVPGDWLLAAIRRGSRVFIPRGTDKLRLGDTAYIIASSGCIKDILPAFDPEVRPIRTALIFGAEVAGIELSRRLSKRLRRVALLEPDHKKAQAAAIALDEHGVEVIHGSALDESLLLRSGMDRADVFVGISPDDENNFVGALLFRKLGSGGNPIVVTSQPHYLEVLESVDLDLCINPRLLAVSAILRYLRGGSVLSVARLREEDAEMVEFHLPGSSPLVGKALKDLKVPGGALITAVLRNDEVSIPSGGFVMAADDRVLVFAETGRSDALAAFFR